MADPPHRWQNLAPAVRGSAHPGHGAPLRGAPQSAQKRPVPGVEHLRQMVSMGAVDMGERYTGGQVVFGSYGRACIVQAIPVASPKRSNSHCGSRAAARWPASEAKDDWPARRSLSAYQRHTLASVT